MSAFKAAGVYERVGEKSGPLVIGGADKKMKEDPTFTYDPLHKKAAPLPELKEWLKKNHPDEAKDALRCAFNLKNLEKDDSIREAYEREIENAEEERRCANEDRKKKLRFNLELVVKFDKMLREQKKNQKDVKATTKGTGKRHSDLRSKVRALKGEGKVLNVTNMDGDGKKAKKEDWKSGASRRRLSTDKTDRFYYVVYNPQSSNASVGVRNFLEKYDADFEDSQIDNTVDAIEDGNKVNFSRGKSPTRSSPHLSPKSRKKKSGDKKTSGSKRKPAPKAAKSRKTESEDEDSDDDKIDAFKGMTDDEDSD